CLEKKREERFQSARDLAFALEAISGFPSSNEAPLAPGRRVGTASPPSFRQLTFRRGILHWARFAPDGHTMVYGAAWEGKPFELFSTRIDSSESRALGFPGADLLAISSKGEMAMALGRRFCRVGGGGFIGTLARAPLAGGAAREILEDVR